MNENFKKLLVNLMQNVGELMLEEEREKPKNVVNYYKKDGILYIKEISPFESQNKAREPFTRSLTTEYHEETKTVLKSNLSIDFTQKEINSMPKSIKKTLLLKGLVVHCRQRKDKNSISYEMRYRKEGYNISVSGTTQEIVKARFLDKLKNLVNTKSPYPTLFVDFALYYIENYKKKKVIEKQYKNALMRLKNDIAPTLKNVLLTQVSPLHCQTIIEKPIKQGHGRKAEDIKTLLNQVFNYAKKLDLLKVNPIDLIVINKHERKHGRALTKEEEKALFMRTKNSPLQIMFAVALYCGLRPVEYATAKIDGAFIVCQNAKRKNGKVEYKRIPITPMLEPYIKGVESLNFYHYNTLKNLAKDYLYGQTLYCLRTTFFNRCIECNINQDVRDAWLGHKTNNVRQAYTDISTELHLRESEKFNYKL